MKLDEMSREELLKEIAALDHYIYKSTRYKETSWWRGLSQWELQANLDIEERALKRHKERQTNG